MICKNCGNEIKEGTKFCAYCGAPAEEAAAEETVENTVNTEEIPKTETAGTPDTEAPKPRVVELPMRYKPLGMWTYFLYDLLFAIPLVGLVFLLIFSFGGTKNVNLQNYSRSHFCWFIIGLIALIAVVVLSITGSIILPNIDF